jgi:hypothetical protein
VDHRTTLEAAPAVTLFGNPAMHTVSRSLLLSLVCLGLIDAAQARVWTDKTGLYTVDADLFAFDGENVIVKRKDGHLGMFEVKDLSDEDQEYLKSEEALQMSQENLGQEQAWTMKDGYRLIGRIVDYKRVNVTFQRRRGRSFVNDRQYSSLPDMYQLIIRKTLEHLTGIANMDDRKLEQWFVTTAGKPQTFEIEGVVIELKDGNEYTVPFFLFSDESLELLKGGWDEWNAAHQDYETQKDESFRLQSTAAAMQRERAMEREIAVANMTFNAVAAGVTSLWEVTLYPANGNLSAPGWVVVEGRNSEQAKFNALSQNPGFVSGPIRKVSRRRF